MLKTLVSLNADLASSLALRYACQMAHRIGMDLQTIHVEEPGAEGHPPGTGWVRRTWEKALLKAGQEEISQLMQAERCSCPPLAAPKMIVGDREEEILNELEKEPYDLFVEGALCSFASAGFYSKLRSRLYRQVSCPVILVKNLTDLKTAALIKEEGANASREIDAFLKIFEKADMEVDLICCRFGLDTDFRAGEEKDPERFFSAETKLLKEAGLSPRACRVLQGAPEQMGEFFKDYGIVATSLDRGSHRRGHLTELLSHVPTPILFC